MPSWFAASAAPVELPESSGGLWARLREGLLEACQILQGYWRQPNANRTKADGSPVSEADEAANRFLLRLLEEVSPGLPVVSEESPLPGNGWDAPCYWLLDPLDGTKAFLRGEREYVISLGLIHQGRPVFGVIAAPVWKETPVLAWGKVGEGAWMQMQRKCLPIEARRLDPRGMEQEGMDILLAYRGPTPQVDRHFSRWPVRARTPCSSALKFLLLAQGNADCYPRFARLQQWDLAGGEALLLAAGGQMTGMDGQPLSYGPGPSGLWQAAPFMATGQGGLPYLLAGVPQDA